MFDLSTGAAGVEIHPFDPLTASRADWAQLHAYRRVRDHEDHPGEPTLPDPEFEHALRMHRPFHESRRLLAMRTGSLVGSLVLDMRRAGSPGYEEHAPFVHAGGGVLRAHRGQGVGKALLGALGRFMRTHGKTTATMKVHLPEGRAFMAAIGATAKFECAENRLAFDTLQWGELAQWRARATLGNGLHWETHAGRVPLERLATLMAPFTALINEQPLGTLEMPRIRYEIEGYTTWYADMDRRGGEHFLVMLCHGEELAAMCDASWDARYPERVYQQLTAVTAPWRAKGLAKAVKAAMLQLVRQRHPDVRTMITTNADANAPMLAINRRLGFAVHRREVTYQIGSDALDRALLAASSRSCGGAAPAG